MGDGGSPRIEITGELSDRQGIVRTTSRKLDPPQAGCDVILAEPLIQAQEANHGLSFVIEVAVYEELQSEQLAISGQPVRQQLIRYGLPCHLQLKAIVRPAGPEGRDLEAIQLRC